VTRTDQPVVTRRHHLQAALADAGFRRLFAVRMSCQFGDGVFQAGLAGAVLFSPERSADPAGVAAGFAVLLLPYSLIGPFAGVLLDRWRRRRVLVVANIARAVAVLAVAAELASGLSGLAFYATALVVLSISRFVLSALSAALPHVMASEELVTANALSTTCGTVIGAAGGAAALGARALLGDFDAAYALVAAAAAVPYLAGAAAAAGFGRDALGPSAAQRTARETMGEVARGLVAGAQHVRARVPVRNGLLAIGVHRLGYGVTTVCTLLLYRNYFTSDGIFRAGLAGLSQVIAAVATGGALAAVVTPAAFRRFGAVRWPAGLLALAVVVELCLVLPYEMPALLVAALVLGFAAQGIKISVDTLVQLYIDDAFRGRVFALYDTMFNVALVVAAVLTAMVLPADGHSPASVIVIAAAYAATALVYVTNSRRTTAAAR
jgi:MFS transporter